MGQRLVQHRYNQQAHQGIRIASRGHIDDKRVEHERSAVQGAAWPSNAPLLENTVQ